MAHADGTADTRTLTDQDIETYLVTEMGLPPEALPARS